MAVVGSYVALSKPLAEAIPICCSRRCASASPPSRWCRGRRPAPATSKPSRRDWRQLFLQSFFGNFLFSICMLNGVALTSASAAGIILATMPAVVAVFSAMFLASG
jgi:drug/metabolite transporter (DMT)-like permease